MDSENTSSAYVFHFTGSDNYIIVFNLAGTSLLSHCTCPYGDTGSLCAHRMNILSGGSGYIPENERELQKSLVAALESSPKGQELLLKVRTQTYNGKACPRCQSSNIRIVFKSSLDRLIGRLRGRRSGYHCDDCDYDWQ